MTTTRPLGVAVVGLGVGEEHARAYAGLKRCQLRWLYDLDADRGRSVRTRLGQGQLAATFEQVLADPAVDIVSIASYDDAHVGQVVAALQAGKHVFVEKPLCRTRDELRAVRAAWRSSRRLLVSNFVLRAAPLFDWLRSAVRAAELGTVYAFDGDYLYGRLHKITEGWRKDVPGYSVMLGGGVHLVDLLLWVTGAVPESVSAAGNRICSTGTDFRYDDYVTATFRFSSGLVGRITANFGCVHRHQHVVRVFGTRGTFIYDDAGARLHTARDETAAVPIDRSSRPTSKGDLIPHFVEAIGRGDLRESDTEHEFAVIRACVAADEALDLGKSVEIGDE